jgi:hypothetical protein
VVLIACGCGKASGASAAFVDAGATASIVAATPSPAPPRPANGDAGALAAETPEPLPKAAGPDLALRGQHLLEAIVHDDASLAADIEFPRDAFMETKDNPDPGKLWDKKVHPGFARDIHLLRKRISLPDKVQFTSFEIGHSVVQTVPKKKDLKRTVWRVRNSKLSYMLEGKAQRIEIAELTSWRGNWYVSKLK